MRVVRFLFLIFVMVSPSFLLILSLLSLEIKRITQWWWWSCWKGFGSPSKKIRRVRPFSPFRASRRQRAFDGYILVLPLNWLIDAFLYRMLEVLNVFGRMICMVAVAWKGRGEFLVVLPVFLFVIPTPSHACFFPFKGNNRCSIQFRTSWWSRIGMEEVFWFRIVVFSGVGTFCFMWVACFFCLFDCFKRVSVPCRSSHSIEHFIGILLIPLGGRGDCGWLPYCPFWWPWYVGKMGVSCCLWYFEWLLTIVFTTIASRSCSIDIELK